MTYAELIIALNKLTDSQLGMDVKVYVPGLDDWLDAILTADYDGQPLISSFKDR